ncbi:hypothetical protein C5167_032559 [Papaver somniferum]|uniref:Uncharacterized protein n=1 Tax=Papaver somniferum TaxID=3469 RepID=A0A4Y7KBZ1_PAPSO|nr:hypothetical protein C5167_032559 [Papaver somniferum]
MQVFSREGAIGEISCYQQQNAYNTFEEMPEPPVNTGSSSVANGSPHYISVPLAMGVMSLCQGFGQIFEARKEREFGLVWSFGLPRRQIMENLLLSVDQGE